jgi:cephalosporin hydroxylase
VKAIVVPLFARYYYSEPERTWRNTRWLGVGIEKLPADMWIYQELLYELRPDLIVETGTLHGGSAYYLATVCDLLGHGQVVTIDVEHREGRPLHPRIEYVTASSTSPATISAMKERAARSETVLVVLDSDHSCDHCSGRAARVRADRDDRVISHRRRYDHQWPPCDGGAWPWADGSRQRVSSRSTI